MNNIVLEHEILKILFTQTGLIIRSVGNDVKGRIPIFKRNYGHNSLHYGTLVDVMNNPEKYKIKPHDKESISFWQDKVTMVNEIKIKKFGYYEISDALELMQYNKHIEDLDLKHGFEEDVAGRIIKLTYDGAIAYLNGYYLKEYKKKQFEDIGTEKQKLDLAKLRMEYSDYPITKTRAKWSFIFSIITVVISIVALFMSIEF